MVCLEGLPVTRKAGPAGLRARERARSVYGGSLPARSLGGNRGPATCLALGAGPQPATPALITGALTWLAVTARHDLAPPG